MSAKKSADITNFHFGFYLNILLVSKNDSQTQH